VRLIDDLTINLYSEFTDFYTQEVLNIISSISSFIMMACEKNKYIEKLQYLTFYDEITNLGNLNKFKKDFNEYHDKYILCMINIKDFTSINANFGFEFGNKVLKKVAEALKKHIKKDDEVYRMYDDRFLLFLKTSGWNLEIIKNITQRLYHIFSEKGLLINKQKVYLEINGTAVSSNDIEKEKAIEGLIYASVFVKNVVNKFVIYQPWMYEEVKERIYLKELLFKAIREKLFDVYFQPIVDINSYKVVQFEALLRLKDNNKFVNMENFINIANEIQLVPEITKIVIEKVIEYMKMFKKVKKDIAVSINISKHDIKEGFLEFFKDMVIVNELDFKNFSLEITERESIENTELTKNFVKELKKVGVKLEIDDFGVAYSNLKQTVSIDFDILKIDKSFVDKIYEEKIQIAIKSTIFLAKSFNAKTIAEGVETKEQLEILKELGVDYIQGYYFAKPMSFNKAVEYLKSHI
jgi:diguanylate cyclase (GGDEF)-like protein